MAAASGAGAVAAVTGNLLRPLIASPMEAGAAAGAWAGVVAAGGVLTMIAAAIGWTVVFPASTVVAVVAVVVASLFSGSPAPFLSPADCLAGPLGAGADCTCPGSAAGAISLAFATSGCGGGFGLVVLCGLAVEPSCAGDLLLPDAVGGVAVVLAAVGVFAAGWSIGACDACACAGGELLASCVDVFDFAELFD